MQMSRLISQTLRDAPADVVVASHRLLVRAGFILQVGAGIFTYLPLARRALTKIENIMRQEIEAIGGQEVTMPVVHPADLWRETGRWYQIGSEMGRSLDADWEGLDVQYRAHYQAYFNIFGRCGLPVIAVKSDVGMMGGSMAHEFMYLTPIGEDILVICDHCEYTANRYHLTSSLELMRRATIF
jgi:prolyl-tRNA synthetase